MWVVVGFYAFALAVLTVLIGPMIWAMRKANRACKSRRWPKVLALIFWTLCITVMLAPYAVFGIEWTTAWTVINLPFSMVLEMWATTGAATYISICSIVTATFWTTVVFVLSALVVRFRRTAA